MHWCVKQILHLVPSKKKMHLIGEVTKGGWRGSTLCTGQMRGSRRPGMEDEVTSSLFALDYNLIGLALYSFLVLVEIEGVKNL